MLGFVKCKPWVAKRQGHGPQACRVVVWCVNAYIRIRTRWIGALMYFSFDCDGAGGAGSRPSLTGRSVKSGIAGRTVAHRSSCSNKAWRSGTRDGVAYIGKSLFTSLLLSLDGSLQHGLQQIVGLLVTLVRISILQLESVFNSLQIQVGCIQMLYLQVFSLSPSLPLCIQLCLHEREGLRAGRGKDQDIYSEGVTKTSDLECQRETVR